MKGLFVVFEGMTGSGKKSQIRLLTERLQKAGREVVNISFPNYETEIARITKRGDVDAYTQSLLFAADRQHYQQRIKQLLDRDAVIICDRYCYSNFAYQSVKGILLEWLVQIEKNIVKPGLVVFIDVPVQLGMSRVQQANIEDFTKKEILERLERERENLEKIREMYLYLSKAEIDKETHWLVLNGELNESVLHEQIWNVVINHLS
jgi:dTMP kinase